MKEGYSVYQLNHDVQNIIEFMLFYNHMKNTNNEYRRVFYFFDTIYDGVCPNPHGRCVTKYIDIKIHWLNGLYHKNLKKGPAIEYLNDGINIGSKRWYYKGYLHRDPKDGPAIELADGYKEWYYKGQLHRNSNDGPAIEFAIDDDRPNEYWEFGKRVK